MAMPPSSSEHAKALGLVAAAAANSTETATAGGGGGACRRRSQKRSRSSSERSIQPQPPAKRSALEDDALLLWDGADTRLGCMTAGCTVARRRHRGEPSHARTHARTHAR
eukprot:SAG25_NODE_470_length_7663_cov_2.756114_12_plen_109_part_01